MTAETRPAAAAVHRHHAMPFGAEPAPGGGTRFRLWAPAHAGHRARWSRASRALPMISLRGGLARAGRDRGRARHALSLRAAGRAAGARSGLALPARGRARPERGRSTRRPMRWSDASWRGRPWDEAVLYELHVGAFTPEGTFRARDRQARPSRRARRHGDRDHAGRRFSRARATGATTACCPTRRTPAYGRPEDFKALVEAAHARGLMVLLDVVYNHFGPDGNYLARLRARLLHRPAQDALGRGDQLSTARDSRPGARFVIHNALYWLEEFHLDGLRLDAVHAILDDSADASPARTRRARARRASATGRST